MVQVFQDADFDSLQRWFGPLNHVAGIVNGSDVYSSWYGVVWLEGTVAVAVAETIGTSDLFAVAEGLAPWNGKVIQFAKAPDGYTLMPSQPGTLADTGPAFLTTYSTAAGSRGIDLSLVYSPGAPALARLVDPNSTLISLDDHDAVLVMLGTGVGATLIWDEADGAQVTVKLTSLSDDERIDRDRATAIANSVVRMNYDDWSKLSG